MDQGQVMSAEKQVATGHSLVDGGLIQSSLIQELKSTNSKALSRACLWKDETPRAPRKAIKTSPAGCFTRALRIALPDGYKHNYSLTWRSWRFHLLGLLKTGSRVDRGRNDDTNA